jgi:hypothetical protein
MAAHYHDLQREQTRRRYAVCAALLSLLDVVEPGSQTERQARGLLSTLEAELQARPSEPTRVQRRAGLQTMKRND